MSVKGLVRIPDPVTEDVLRVIASMKDHEVFTFEDVATRTGRNARQVKHVVINKSHQGCLEKVSPGKYRKGGTRIKTCIPLGMVSEAVWAVLSTQNNPRPMRLAEIVGEVESYIGRPGYRAYTSVNSILRSWHETDHLERSGKYHEYAYLLKDGVTERPITNSQ